MGVVQGWGIQMVRLLSWQRQARMAQKGLKLTPATTAMWRHQFGSAARTWAAVEVEATELIAVWTMCRLMETAYMYDLVEQACQCGACADCGIDGI